MVYIAFYIAVDFALRVIQKAIRTLKNLDFDFSKESLYHILATRYNIHLVRAEQTMESGLATPQEIELLQTTSPAPVLRIERLSYNEQNRLV